VQSSAEQCRAVQKRGAEESSRGQQRRREIEEEMKSRGRRVKQMKSRG
jgi:hypothetical protein